MKLKFENKYVKWGITVFITAVLVIIVFFAIYRMTGLAAGLSKLAEILSPFVWGLVMAFLACPLYNWGVRTFKKVSWPKFRGRDHSRGIAMTIASILVILAIAGVVIGLFWAIIPGLVDSVVKLVKTMPTTISDFEAWLAARFASLPKGASGMESYIDGIVTKFKTWIANSVFDYDTIMNNVQQVAYGAARGVMNFIIGIVICIFFINSKEIFASQAKKLIFAVMSEEKADAFLRGAAFTNKTFFGFITGKLIDSLIIGLICFVFMMIFGWPYPVLISVVIGVTNIIPFFGPFIGAIPSALLILTVDPLTCLYFLIFIFILQQIDGNIIGPTILGDSTGLSSFWVMFAIIVGGGLFGFLGMVVSVPLFAVIYAYCCYAVNRRLEKKGLSTDLRDYKTLYKYDGRRPNMADDGSDSAEKNKDILEKEKEQKN